MVLASEFWSFLRSSLSTSVEMGGKNTCIGQKYNLEQLKFHYSHAHTNMSISTDS